MANIKSITDSEGVGFYPRTHTKAVVDDNGYTVESRLQATEDIVNQAQLEIGAVQSDLTPTKNSTNWVTSGGIYNGVPSNIEGTNDSDLDIVDEEGNVLVSFADGGIKTKNFDSEKVGYTYLEKFKDKKFAIIGDSISTYSGWLPSDISGYDGSSYNVYYPSGDVNNVSKTWWYQALQMIDVTPTTANVNNCSWSGSRVTGDSSSTTSASAACSTRRISDLSIKGWNPDIIIIFISCNDWGNNISLGDWKVSDAIPSDGTISTARAGYALMLNKIHVSYPKARIFCCTILDDYRRDSTSGWPSNNSSGVTTYQWNQNIKEIAGAFGCDIIDMHSCGVNYSNIASLAVDTGLHPNAEAMTMMAKKVASELISKY